ncbi:uncharacterized protein LOC141536193 [Cotesia typhae]|uniref:uncharacterized protein LOC141536193 n=1 Tax=Cotesia typhae TaxID=2053667 RepID=UPI003D68E328
MASDKENDKADNGKRKRDGSTGNHDGSPSPKRVQYEEMCEQMRALQGHMKHLVNLYSQRDEDTQSTVEEPPLSDTLNLGKYKTEVNAKKKVVQADPTKLQTLSGLQRFEMDDWKDIRYGDTLKEFSASPGFTELKVNEELCYLDKGKDYQQSTERVLAGLANAVLTQNEVLQATLQGIIEWAKQYPEGIGSQDLINMFNLNFREKSETFRNSEKMLKIICGKRASCIEARRDRIINEAPNKQVQGALKRIPPSSQHLFEKPALSNNWRDSRYETPFSDQMTEQIELMLRQGVLEKITDPGPSFVSRMFLIKKSDGGWRPIFDLRNLNRYVEVKEFQLISHSKIPDFLQPRDWLVRIDMSQAYFHIRVSEAHRRFLRVHFRGELLQMTCMPFGLSSAPYAFASVSNWIAELIRSRGIRVAVYLDDFLVACQNRSKLLKQIEMIVRLLVSLGWQINWDKSILEPCQELDFLGITWSTQTGVIKLPLKKAVSIQTLVQEGLRDQSCTLKKAQSLLGHLNFASFVVPRGQLHCRHLQRFSTHFSQNRPRQRLRINNQVQNDLTWWKEATSLCSPLHKSKVTHFLTTDAVDRGWGAQLNGIYMSGNWSATQKKWHSNKKELLAVYQALKQQAHLLKEAHILLQTDNRTVVAYIRKEGGTRSLELYELTFQLLSLVDELKITLSAFYFPGRYNGIADRLSRKRTLPEWHLLPEATETVFKTWGTPEIDLFASAKSAVVKRYASRDCKDRLAAFTDAFSQSWSFKLAWIFPPPSLIPRVLAHLNESRGHFLIVAPKWEKTFWMPDLVNRSRNPPITIQNLERVLIDLTTGSPPPQVDQLTLQVWRIGCGDPLPRTGTPVKRT